MATEFMVTAPVVDAPQVTIAGPTKSLGTLKISSSQMNVPDASTMLASRLVGGWTLASTICKKCTTVPLMKDPKSGELLCVVCDVAASVDDSSTTNSRFKSSMFKLTDESAFLDGAAPCNQTSMPMDTLIAADRSLQIEGMSAFMTDAKKVAFVADSSAPMNLTTPEQASGEESDGEAKSFDLTGDHAELRVATPAAASRPEAKGALLETHQIMVPKAGTNPSSSTLSSSGDFSLTGETEVATRGVGGSQASVTKLLISSAFAKAAMMGQSAASAKPELLVAAVPVSNALEVLEICLGDTVEKYAQKLEDHADIMDVARDREMFEAIKSCCETIETVHNTRKLLLQ